MTLGASAPRWRSEILIALFASADPAQELLSKGENCVQCWAVLDLFVPIVALSGAVLETQVVLVQIFARIVFVKAEINFAIAAPDRK